MKQKTKTMKQKNKTMKQKTQCERLKAHGAGLESISPKTPSEIFSEILRKKYSNFQEKFEVLVFDTSMRFIRSETIAAGSVSSTALDIATLFRVVFLCAGNNFIVAHNHPSGTLSPSAEDIQVTKHISDCAKMLRLNFLDHIIYSETGYLSLKTQGLF